MMLICYSCLCHYYWKVRLNIYAIGHKGADCTCMVTIFERSLFVVVAAAAVVNDDDMILMLHLL